MWRAGPNHASDEIIIQIIGTAGDREKTVAMNEALMLGSLRQHELRAESELANVQLQAAQNALGEANRLLGDRAVLLETLVQHRTAKLRETVAELEAFSYSIAHDLRAPVRSMAVFAEILLEEHAKQLDFDGLHFLRRIGKSAGLMDQLIRDVLNYGQVLLTNLPLETVDLRGLLAELMESYPLFVRQGVNIVIEGPFPSVLGHAAMLMQVLSHLLSNAVKFAKEGERPQIKVWTELQGERVKVFIRDHGIGIRADQHERIFGMFEQLDRVCDGTGIGLAIVKKALDRMGGRVGVDSTLGQGATFWFELQRA
jgi:signal transduction histidine kinase